MSQEEEADVIMYAQGVFHAAVCTTLPREKILARVNEDFASGTSNGWSFAEAASFASGAPNPCPCPGNNGRTHYLLAC